MTIESDRIRIRFKGWMPSIQNVEGMFQSQPGDLGYLSGTYDPMFGYVDADMDNGEHLELYPEEFEVLIEPDSSCITPPTLPPQETFWTRLKRKL